MSHMQTTQAEINFSGAEVIRDLVGAIGNGDINLDHHQVWFIIPIQVFHVLVDKFHFLMGRQTGS